VRYAASSWREVGWRFFLTQRSTQFRQGDILELTNSLSRNPELLTHFFEGLRFVTVQPESLEDYLALAASSSLIGASNDAGRIEAVFN
jgi:hypothetical protein